MSKQRFSPRNKRLPSTSCSSPTYKCPPLSSLTIFSFSPKLHWVRPYYSRWPWSTTIAHTCTCIWYATPVGGKFAPLCSLQHIRGLCQPYKPLSSQHRLFFDVWMEKSPKAIKWCGHWPRPKPRPPIKSWVLPWWEHYKVTFELDTTRLGCSYSISKKSSGHTYVRSSLDHM